jgi:uncharacterized protein YacL
MTFANISNFFNVNDYLSIINGCLGIDIIMIFALFNNIYKSEYLKKWYIHYQLSAVIADTLIIVIGIILARFFYKFIFSSFSIWKFTALAVLIQIIHDLLFYHFFKSVPKDYNFMLDFFKKYANEVSFYAIIADSFMMIMACLFSSYFASLSLNTNILILILQTYLVPYFINFKN